MLLIAVVASAGIGAAPMNFRPTMMSPPAIAQPVVRPVTSTASATKPLTTPARSDYSYYALRKAELTNAEPRVFSCILGMEPATAITSCPTVRVLVP
jgi:hypothetical protein